MTEKSRPQPGASDDILDADAASARVVENPNVPVVYVDGLLDIEINEPNARLTFFEFRHLGSELVKSPVLEMIRPAGTCGQVFAAMKRRLEERQKKSRQRAH